MKRALQKILTVAVLALLLAARLSALAESADGPEDLKSLFDQHGAVMLLIDPGTGAIVGANEAAANFYGYSEPQLLSMNISDINTLSPEETAAEMSAAEAAQRNYFLFQHRLAGGEVRSVEVYSYPVEYEGRSVLFSVIHDVTDRIVLERTTGRLTLAGFALSALILAILALWLARSIVNHRKLRKAYQEIESSARLLKTFIDAQGDLAYLKDEHLRYVFVNRAFEAFYEKRADQVIGQDDYALSERSFADLRKKTDLEVLKNGAVAHDEVVRDGKTYATTKFPVQMLDGRMGIGAYVRDVTLERQEERRRGRAAHRFMILTDVLSRSFQNPQEQLNYVLRKALELTESAYGYIYLYDEERREFTLSSLSREAAQDSRVPDAKAVCPLEDSTFWGEAVRRRKPLVVNDFEKSNPLKKGLPEGHLPVRRILLLPVIIEGALVAMLGLANKPAEYDEYDIHDLTVLMNGAWNTLRRHEYQERLKLERSRYLQTLVSIGDGVMVVTRDGAVEMLNAVAERLTGWASGDAVGRHYAQVFAIRHEDAAEPIADPIAAAIATGTVQELSNHAILTSRDGNEYFLEDSAAPIRNEAGEVEGVVLVFRDVTQKKQQRQQIEYLSLHDPLTGLYNRRFFNDELRRLDTPRNLPLTIVMGDINGLKLTNDVFGHFYGDLLLERIAQVLRQSCRADDIMARWGGDEFVLLLPRTGPEEAAQIIARVKREFSREKIKAIKGSISMGLAYKDRPELDAARVLTRAEEAMYNAKTLEKDEVHKSTIEEIIQTLHRNSARESEHSKFVGELAPALGRRLNLPEEDIRKLRDAGYLHDIGKIVLEPKLLNINHHLSENEWGEIRRHPIVGYRILNAFDETMNLAEPVLAHQERWDGTGYPRGLKGAEIPLLARIITVAESYDRMVNDAANAHALTREEAIRELRDNAGAQFDPGLVEAFIQMLKAQR